MLRRIAVSAVGLLMVALCLQPLGSQTSKQSVPTTRSLPSQIESLAQLRRAGDTSHTIDLVHLMFASTSIPSTIADSLGFTNRLVSAEVSYRRSHNSSVHEADIERAINNFANRLDLPTWTRTNGSEVRLLRMRMLASYPNLIASHSAPDAAGHYTALDSDMSPLEASYVVTSLLYQKLHNADFQFTRTETQNNANLRPEQVNRLHLERSRELADLVNGRGPMHSVRDVVDASDQLFSDLGMAEAEVR